MSYFKKAGMKLLSLFNSRENSCSKNLPPPNKMLEFINFAKATSNY